MPASSWLPLWAQFLQHTRFVDLVVGCPLGHPLPGMHFLHLPQASNDLPKLTLESSVWTQPPTCREAREHPSGRVLLCTSGWKCPFL